MSVLILDISISLDGYATAAGVSDDEPMGIGGQRLHAWASGDDPEGNAILEESNGRVGGTIAGRRTYDRSLPFWGADGPGGSERTPTFIVSHTVPDNTPDGGVYTFVDSSQKAVAAARAAAGIRPIDVFSPSIGRQLLQAGIVDELRLHVSPIVLSGGFDLLTRSDRSSSSCFVPAERASAASALRRSARFLKQGVPPMDNLEDAWAGAT